MMRIRATLASAFILLGTWNSIFSVDRDKNVVVVGFYSLPEGDGFDRLSINPSRRGASRTIMIVPGRLIVKPAAEIRF